MERKNLIKSISAFCSHDVGKIYIQDDKRAFNLERRFKGSGIDSVYFCFSEKIDEKIAESFDFIVDFSNTNKISLPFSNKISIYNNHISNLGQNIKANIEFSQVSIYSVKVPFVLNESKRIPHTSFNVKINENGYLMCDLFQNKTHIATLKSNSNNDDYNKLYQEHLSMSKSSFYHFSSFDFPAEYFTKKSESLIHSQAFGKRNKQKFNLLKGNYFNEIAEKTEQVIPFYESNYYNEILLSIHKEEDLKQIIINTLKIINPESYISFTFSHGDFSSSNCAINQDKIIFKSLEKSSYQRPKYFDFFYDQLSYIKSASDFSIFFNSLNDEMKKYLGLYLVGAIFLYPMKRKRLIKFLKFYNLNYI